MEVPGASRINLIRKPTTISVSARCARISLTDHLSGAGRLRSFDVGCYPLNVLLCCFVHCVRLPPLCEYGTRGRHWGVASVRGHGRDSVRRRGRADYPNLAGKANQWPVIGGQFRALSSRYSALILSCQARLTRTCDQFPSNKTSAGERLCISRQW